MSELDNYPFVLNKPNPLPPPPEEAKENSSCVPWAIGLFVIVAVLLTYMAPRMHGPVNRFFGRSFNHTGLYQHTQTSIDEALLDTRYSVMHLPEAGIAIIFKVNKSDALILSDTTAHLTENPFCIYIPQERNYHWEAGSYCDVPDLANSYALRVPQKAIAAVIADMSVTSQEDLSAVLKGLQRVQIGPQQTTGAYALWDGDHTLLAKLHATGAVHGRLQVVFDPTPVALPRGDIIVPLEKHQVMDITAGEDTRGSQPE